MLERFLKKIGVLVGLDFSYFFRNGIWISIRYFAISFSGLMITVAFTRFSDKETFGQFQFILATMGFLSFFSLPGLNTLSLREAVGGNFEAVKKSAFISFCSSFFITVISGILGIWMFWNERESLGLAFMVVAFLSPFFYGTNNWYVFYEAGLDFRTTTLRIIFSSIFVALVTIVMIIFREETWRIIGAYLGISSLFGLIYFTEAIRGFSIKIKRVAIDFRYGFACTVQKFTTSVMNENIPALAIASLYGFQELAIFQVPYFCFASLSGFLGSLSSLYMPLLFRRTRIYFVKILLQNIGIGAIFALLYIVAIRIFFVPLFGVAYQESLSLAFSFSFLVPMIPIRIFLMNYYSSRNRNNLISATNAFSGIVVVFFLWFFRELGLHLSAIIAFGVMYSIQIIIPLGVSTVEYLEKKERKTI